MKSHLLLALMAACAVKGFRVARKDGAESNETARRGDCRKCGGRGNLCPGNPCSRSSDCCGAGCFKTYFGSPHPNRNKCDSEGRTNGVGYYAEEGEFEATEEMQEDMAVDKDLVESSSSSGCLAGRRACGSGDSASTGHRACAARCCSKGSDCKKSGSRWACWCKSAAELDAIADEEETESLCAGGSNNTHVCAWTFGHRCHCRPRAAAELDSEEAKEETEIGDAYSETAIEEMQEDMAVDSEEATDTVDAASANTVLNLVNAERRKVGAPALRLNGKLNSAASVHAQDMARMGRMTHTGSDGSSAGTRVTRAGYRWSAVGENVANGQSSANEVVRSWMNSKQGHREAILNTTFTEMGYAVRSKRHCQVFARPR